LELNINDNRAIDDEFNKTKKDFLDNLFWSDNTKEEEEKGDKI